MAKVKHDPTAPAFSGSVGNFTYYERDGKQCVREKPQRDPNLPWSDEQLSEQDVFRKAQAYAKGVKNDPAQKAIYEVVARAEHRDAYHRALSDALTDPVVLEINASGYTGEAGHSILIRAKDDFEVAQVLVSIRDPAGTVLEEGAASLASKESGEWTYPATVPVPPGLAGVVIAVTVTDRPGNKAVAQIDHLLRRADG